MRLLDKTAIITGSGSGFGAEMARRFVTEGARVVCADINPKAATAVADELGSAAFPVQCDVADDRSVQSMVEAVAGHFGSFDIVINNAAISQTPKRIAKSTAEEIDRLFAVNVRSLYHMAVHALPVLRAGGGGSVLNMTSVTALRPRPGMTWYNASKAAVISVTQSMAAELAPDRIRVNALAPGVSRTPMFDAIFGGGDRSDSAQRSLEESFPLGRLSRPSDIAAAAVYLSSDEAEYVTGVVLPVDGGRLVG